MILIDNKFISRNIPLHSGNGLKELKNIEGYDEKIHRWISGDDVYKYLFDQYDWKKIKIKNY